MTYGILYVIRCARATTARHGACLQIVDKRFERYACIADKRTDERLCDLVRAEERRVVRAIFTRGQSEDVPRCGSLDEYRAVTE